MRSNNQNFQKLAARNSIDAPRHKAGLIKARNYWVVKIFFRNLGHIATLQYVELSLFYKG